MIWLTLTCAANAAAVLLLSWVVYCRSPRRDSLISVAIEDPKGLVRQYTVHGTGIIQPSSTPSVVIKSEVM